MVDGRIFEILKSSDLVNWSSIGGAVEPADKSAYEKDWWAPDVAFDDGLFYLYCSVGFGDKGHQIRVCTAQYPQGPFRETGEILTPNDPFAIDACHFRDDDGQCYMYYARDFLDGERVGTALAVDQMTGMGSLEGNHRTVLRATQSWQLFRRKREIYGSVYDWHTLEGPFVRKHGGKYYCFYSGGLWEGPSYGVSFAVADSPLGPFEEPPLEGPQILKSVPGVLEGPGHTCIVEGPEGASYIAYHAWDSQRTARRLCIDRLQWTERGPRCLGPTHTPQPVPGGQAP